MEDVYRNNEPDDEYFGEERTIQPQYVLLAVAVIIMLGIIIFFTARSLRNGSGTTDQLSSIDRTISENSEILAKTNDFASESTEHYNAIDKTLDEIQRKLIDYSGKIDGTTDAKARKEMKTTLSTLETEVNSLIERVNTSRSDTEKLINEIMSAENDNKESITNNTSEIKESTTALKEDLAAKYEALKKGNDSISGSISSLESSLSSLIESYGSKSDANYRDLTSLLKEVRTDLSNTVDTDYRALTVLIDKNGTEIESALDGKIKELTALEKQQYDNLTASQNTAISKIDSLTANVGSNHADLITRSDDIKNTITSNHQAETAQITETTNNLNTNMSEYFTTYNQAQSTGNDALQGLIQALSDNVTQSFISASNGKELLASALLAKGMDVKTTYGQDTSDRVTFKQYADAISGLEQTITVDEIPAASIEYSYHYHVDGNGNNTGEKEYLTDSGGCYTVPYVHHHVGSCYGTVTVEEGPCLGEGCSTDPSTGFQTCRYKRTVTYDNGQTSTSIETRTHAGAGNGGNHVNSSSRSTSLYLKCGLSEGQQLGYGKNCGYNDGQITEAHIKWDPNNGASTLSSEPKTFNAPVISSAQDNPDEESDEAASTKEEASNMASSTADAATGNSATDNTSAGSTVIENSSSADASTADISDEESSSAATSSSPGAASSPSDATSSSSEAASSPAVEKPEAAATEKSLY